MANKQILIIEDDAAILAVTKFSLEMENIWQVVTASQGDDGIKKARDLRPDVILLDIILPKIDGVSIIESLYQDPYTKTIPIILFTSKMLENDCILEQYSNVKGFINKPFDCLALSAKIMKIIDNY